MKEDVYRFIGCVFLTILALLGIGAVLHIMSTLPFGEKLATWLGPIGTIATLLLTIRLATAQARTKKQEQIDAALLAAASMLVRLRNLSRGLTHLRQLLNFEFENLADAYSTAAGWSKFIRDDDLWSEEELLPLIYLPNHTAAALAMIRTNVRAVKLRLANMADDPENVHYSHAQMMRRLHYQVSSALVEIDRAYEQCVNLLLKHGFQQAMPQFDPASNQVRG